MAARKEQKKKGLSWELIGIAAVVGLVVVFAGWVLLRRRNRAAVGVAGEERGPAE